MYLYRGAMNTFLNGIPFLWHILLGHLKALCRRATLTHQESDGSRRDSTGASAGTSVNILSQRAASHSDSGQAHLGDLTP